MAKHLKILLAITPKDKHSWGSTEGYISEEAVLDALYGTDKKAKDEVLKFLDTLFKASFKEYKKRNS